MFDVVRERLTAQLLSGPPAHDPAEVAERLLAIQGQDLKGARLAVRCRSEGVAASDVDRALGEGSLLVTWLNRGTLHLVRSEDYFWLHALTTPPLFTGNARRLAQEGVGPTAAERGVAAVRRALAENGPLTRAQLREHVAAARVRTEGQALVHLLMLACLRGLAVRGPVVGAHHAYALVHDWLGESPPIDRDVALEELARRFLAGHGPADERDLAKWTGLPLRDARRALRLLGSEVVERIDRLFDLARHPPAEALPRPKLLGQFDPVLLGWRSREPILGEHQPLVTVEGLFRPFALVRGRAAGTWRLRDGAVELALFDPLTPADAAALAIDAEDAVRFVGS